MSGIWIRADELRKEPAFYYFDKEFDAREGASLKLNICADNRYNLFINDKLVCEGPCQGSQYVRYYETADLSEYLVPGKNRIRAKVLFLTDNYFISVYRDKYPALWIDGTLTSGGETVTFRTDKSWSCRRVDSVRFNRGCGIHTSVPPLEEILGEESLTPVNVCEMYETDASNDCYNIFGLREKYPLSPRPIPQMATHPSKTLTVVNSGDGFIELDATDYTTAKVYITLKGEPGKTARITYSECRYMVRPDGGLYKDMRDCPEGIISGVSDIIHTTGKEQKLSTFWYRAFRYIRIDYEGELELIDASYSSYFYPMDITGIFECSDQNFNDMWRVSINTVLCCTHEMYIDCPFYEQQQYDMDSTLEILFTYRLTGDTRMPRKCLTDLAHSQLPDGMLQANYPSVGIQVIPGFSLFWIFMLGDYLKYSGDMEFVHTMTSTMDKILEGFRGMIDKDGLVGPSPYWKFVDWVPTWPVGVPIGGNEEPMTVACFMYSAALAEAADICRECGRSGLADEYMSRAAEMNKNVLKHCYDTEYGLFRDIPSKRNFSRHTSVWAILSGAVTGDDAHELMVRTMNAGNEVSPCTFSMNHYLFRALEKSGCYDYAPTLFDGWQKALDMHCTTWCENPDSPRSECHGWSSAPIYEFSAIYLGVKPVDAGFNSVLIKPYTNGLDWASGKIPTPHGLISVEWKKVNGALVLDAELPAGVTATVDLPDHAPFRTKDRELHIEAE